MSTGKSISLARNYAFTQLGFRPVFPIGERGIFSPEFGLCVQTEWVLSVTEIDINHCKAQVNMEIGKVPSMEFDRFVLKTVIRNPCRQQMLEDAPPVPPHKRGWFDSLTQTFPRLDPVLIHSAVSRFPDWPSVVDFLLEQEPVPRPLAQTHDPKAARGIFRPPAAARPSMPPPGDGEGECRLFLPPALADVDIDLENFGFFDEQLYDTGFATPYGMFGAEVSRPIGPMPPFFAHRKARA